MNIQYPYVYVAYQVGKYDLLVRKALQTGNKKLIEVVTDRWYFWMKKFIELSN